MSPGASIIKRAGKSRFWKWVGAFQLVYFGGFALLWLACLPGVDTSALIQFVLLRVLPPIYATVVWLCRMRGPDLLATNRRALLRFSTIPMCIAAPLQLFWYVGVARDVAHALGSDLGQALWIIVLTSAHASVVLEWALRRSTEPAVTVADIPRLIQNLEAQSPMVRELAAQCLGDLEKAGTPAIAALEERLHDEDRRVRLAAAEAMRRILGCDVGEARQEAK